MNPKNARGHAVTKLCLALEAFRRTDEGRIRDAKAFLAHFFPQDKNGATDRLFVHIPNEVRADLLSNWGIRGKKSALRDDNDRVRSTVNDALNAGDIDATVIEEGVTPEILTDWIPLDDWWRFWRGSNLPIGSVRKALALARELALYDERWFLEHLALEAQKLRGTDVICAALPKEQLVTWMQAIHAAGDASPKGMVAALGWEMILAKTAHEALLYALDALAHQIGLAQQGPPPIIANGASTPEPPPTPRMEVPARLPSRPPEPSTPEPGAAATTIPPAESAPSAPPLAPALPKPSVPPPKNPSVKPPPPVSTKPTETPGSKPPPVPAKPPVPTSSKAPPVPSAKPPPVPAAASKPPPVGAGKPPPRSVAPVPADLPSVIIEEDPFFPAAPAASQVPLPTSPSAVPNARALFLGSVAEAPPMRPPMTTLSGVAPPANYGGIATDDVAVPTFTMPPTDPAWAPARAEPGDMGWDLVHGVTRPMGTNVAPKYNFEDDDEPTSEIELPRAMRRPQ